MNMFPFLKLPGELQLLVLGECDPITAGKLLDVSPRLQGLYIRYSERVFRAILSNVPEPIAALARLSLDLFTLVDENFDPIPIMRFLHRHSLFDWHLLQPRPHNLVGDPFGVLSTMVDIFIEVDEAARAIGECLAAGTETFLNPYIQPEPATLSDSEHVRIACSLLVVQVYYQMRVQVAPYPPETSHRFSQAFMRDLKPWQVEQGRCIDHFVRAYCYEWSGSVHCFANVRPSLLSRLSELKYFGRFRRLFENNTAANKFIPHLSRAAAIAQRSQNYIRSGLHVLGDDACNSRSSTIAEQLKNYVWALHEAQAHGSQPHANHDYERQMFWNLGLLFWDPERTVSVHNACSNRSGFPGTIHAQYIHKVGPNPRRHFYVGNLLPHRLADIEYAKSQQIIEWTRCTEQCTMEEWLHWKSDVRRYWEGKKPMPNKYITFGAVCSTCGGDGHWSRRCDSGSWSDDEPDEDHDNFNADSAPSTDKFL